MIPGHPASPPRKSLSRRIAALAAAVVGLAATGPASAIMFDVSIDTSALGGQPVYLEFLLLDGDGVANNTVTISDFSTDGTANGDVSFPGDTSGGPLAVAPGQVLDPFPSFVPSDWIEEVITGNAINFKLNITEDFAGGFVPDSFILTMYREFDFDPFVLLPDNPFPSTQPEVFPGLGGTAILTVDIRGPGAVEFAIYDSLANDATWTVNQVPEPRALGLLAAALLLASFARARTAARA